MTKLQALLELWEKRPRRTLDFSSLPDQDFAKAALLALKAAIPELTSQCAAGLPEAPAPTSTPSGSTTPAAGRRQPSAKASARSAKSQEPVAPPQQPPAAL